MQHFFFFYKAIFFSLLACARAAGHARQRRITLTRRPFPGLFLVNLSSVFFVVNLSSVFLLLICRRDFFVVNLSSHFFVNLSSFFLVKLPSLYFLVELTPLFLVVCHYAFYQSISRHIFFTLSHLDVILFIVNLMSLFLSM